MSDERPIRVVFDASAIGAAADQAADCTYDIVGRVDAASAVLAAIDHDCGLLIRQAALYAGLDGGGLVIPIE